MTEETYYWKARFGVVAGDDGYYYARIIVEDYNKPDWISDHGPYKTLAEATERLYELRDQCELITKEGKHN